MGMQYQLAKRKIRELVDEIDKEIATQATEDYTKTERIVEHVKFRERVFDRAKLIINNFYRDYQEEWKKFLTEINDINNMIGGTHHRSYCKELSEYLQYTVMSDITDKEDIDQELNEKKRSFKQLTSALRKSQDDLQDAQVKINELNISIVQLRNQNRSKTTSELGDYQGDLTKYNLNSSEDYKAGRENHFKMDLDNLKRNVDGKREDILELQEKADGYLEDRNDLLKTVEQNNQMINDISWQRDEITKERDEAIKCRELASTVLNQSIQRLEIQLAERPSSEQYSRLIIFQYILILSLTTVLNFATNQLFATPISTNLVVEGLIVLSLLLFYFRKPISERLKRRLFKKDDRYGRILEFLYEDKSKYYKIEDIQESFQEFNHNEIKITVDKLAMEKMIVFEENKHYSILLPGINYIDGHIKNYQTNLNNVLNLLLRTLPYVAAGITASTLLFNSVFKMPMLQSKPSNDSTKIVEPLKVDASKRKND